MALTSGTGVCRALRERGHQAILVDMFLGLESYEGRLEDIFDAPDGLCGDNRVTEEAPDLEAVRAQRKLQSPSLFGEHVLEVCAMADIVFLALHGRTGEDGRVQATLDLLGIPYTGSGYLGSAIAMDKDLTKRVVAPLGVKTPAWMLVESDGMDIDAVCAQAKLPCVVKPDDSGSSIGVSIANDEAELRAALKAAAHEGSRILIEQYICGREVQIGILGQLTFPFRRYQIGKVWRGERAQRGRFREFYQADIDIIGDGALDILNEAEIPAIIYDTFTRLGLHRFRIRVNNRKVLNGFFAILGLSEQAGDVLRTIDKLDKIGADKVRELLTDTCGVTGENADEILRFIACPGTSADKLAFLEQYRGRNETFDTGLDELRTVVGYLPAFGVPEENFELDLTIARGLDYYTGTVYETVLLDHPEVGSICSGGRYDDLAGYYTNKSLPGVGISIGLTRLFYILQEQNMISDAVLTAPADVLILPMTDDLSAAVALASELRAGGLRVQIYSEKKKFKAKIGYADKLGIPFVIFLGEDEVAQHVCALKNMATGVQEAVTSAAALETIRAEIARRSAGAILREP